MELRTANHTSVRKYLLGLCLAALLAVFALSGCSNEAEVDEENDLMADLSAIPAPEGPMYVLNSIEIYDGTFNASDEPIPLVGEMQILPSGSLEASVSTYEGVDYFSDETYSAILDGQGLTIASTTQDMIGNVVTATWEAHVVEENINGEDFYIIRNNTTSVETVAASTAAEATAEANEEPDDSIVSQEAEEVQALEITEITEAWYFTKEGDLTQIVRDYIYGVNLTVVTSYEFDDEGRLVEIKESIVEANSADNTISSTRTYEYVEQNGVNLIQMLEVDSSGATYEVTYEVTYDEVGNILSIVDVADAIGTTYFTYTVVEEPTVAGYVSSFGNFADFFSVATLPIA